MVANGPASCCSEQHMTLIETIDDKPPWQRVPPPIDAVRPSCCASCMAVADAGSDLLMHGHGVREILVVIPPRHWQGVARLVPVPLRRFRCNRCGATITVHPHGVLPRCAYSLFAIVFAWWSACRPPMGQGLDDAAVYALQGVDRPTPGPEPESRLRARSGVRRWRSLARWAAKIGEWWPGRAVAGATWRERAASLLVGFAAEAGGADVGRLLTRAVAGHAGAGAAM